jgi:glycosyltransferase involved in cell wall biosynthesis
VTAPAIGPLGEGAAGESAPASGAAARTTPGAARCQRLLFVGTNRGGGGTESHFVTLARAMAAAGHEVAAAVWPGEFIHEALAADGRVQLFPACFRKRNDLRATREVMRAARAFRPSWIVGTFKREYWPVAVAARLLGTPAVLFSHLDQRMQPIMLRGLPRVVHRIIAPSEYQRGRLIARGMPATRVDVLYNPVDTECFRIDPALRRESRARLGVAPDEVVVGFAGRIEPEKGVETLAAALREAMDRCARVRALWVGGGRSADALRAEVAAAPHAARHVWEPWTAGMAPLYAAMDLLALPSVGPETFGRVMVEAQACGVPALGSRIGGIPETVEDGVTGLLLPPGDAAAWAGAVLRLAADDPVRHRMGRVGRAFVERVFRADTVAEEFGRLLAAGPRPTREPRRGGPDAVAPTP